MVLKRLILSGFKSFPKKTVINFNRGFTAIVGPNGSGKSNIIDGIRWGLGTLSVKELRGEKMEDVIFFGTESKPPLNMAEVQIIFENNGKIPLDYDEVEVKRRYFLGGESEYYINGVPCRLKDIVENFANTGLLYSILDQTLIEQFLLMDNIKRRQLFESVSGLGKYREDRKEAEYQLRRALSNLEKLDILIGEKKRVLRSLRAQAEKAKKFRRLKESLKEKSILLASHNIYSIDTKLKNLYESIDDMKTKIDIKIKERALLQANREKLLKSSNEVRSDAERLNEEIQVLNELLLKKNGDYSRLKGRLDEMEHTALNFRDLESIDFDSEKEESKKIVRKINELKSDLQSSEKKLESLINEFSRLNNNLFQKESQVLRAQMELNSNKKRIEEEIKESNALKERVKKNDNEKNLLNQEKRKLDFTLRENTELINKLYSNRENLRKKRSIILKKISENERIIANLEARKDAIESIEVEEIDRASSLAKKLQMKILGENIEIEEGYEKAVESVLEEKIFAILGKRKDIDKIIRDTSSKEMGEIIFANEDTGYEGDIKGDLIRRIKKGPGGVLSFLFNNVYVVKTIDEALEKATNDARSTFVTPEGHIVSGPIIKLYGNKKGILVKKSNLREISEKIQKIATALSKLNEENRSLKSAIDELQAAISSAEKKREELISEKSRIESKITEFRYIEDISRGEVEKRESIVKSLKKGMDSIELELKKDKEEIKIIKTELIHIGGTKEEIQHHIENVREMLRRFEEKNSTILEKLSRYEKFKRVGEEKEKVVENTKCLGKEIADYNKKLEALTQRRKSKMETLEEMQTNTKQMDNSINSLTIEIENLNGQLEEMRILVSEYESEKQNIIENTYRGFGVKVTPLNVEEAELLQPEIENIKKKIERIGDVNLLSLEESEKVSDELNRLEKGRVDLQKAKKNIEDTISSIDEKAENKFMITFNKIRENFVRIFKILFEGGEADIKLEGDRPLESVINIYARPKGKKTKRLESLSTGEKTLTSIALLFGIMLSKKTGIFILDEIDAPLDEKNIERFLAFIREIAEESQVIIVTHNRRTMEDAEFIYGVTMENPGISKILTVDRKMIL